MSLKLLTHWMKPKRLLARLSASNWFCWLQRVKDNQVSPRSIKENYSTTKEINIKITPQKYGHQTCAARVSCETVLSRSRSDYPSGVSSKKTEIRVQTVSLNSGLNFAQYSANFKTKQYTHNFGDTGMWG